MNGLNVGCGGTCATGFTIGLEIRWISTGCGGVGGVAVGGGAFLVGVAVVWWPFLLQMLHKHWSPLYLCFSGSTNFKYSEKNRSPLSGGKRSAIGNGVVAKPMSSAIRLM